GEVAALAADVNALALGEVECLAVHAGAVARDGRVVAFPARSGAGKSTLTAACLRAGLDLVSDEALCLDWHTGAVRPYPRPIALTPWSATALGIAPAGPDTLVTATDLGAAVATEPLRLTHVVLLDEPGGTPGPRPERRSTAVAELLRRSFSHWRRPDRAFELAHELLRAVPVHRLSPTDPAADAATLAALLT
ncbi:MAG TPA: hypothetical protein VGD67_27910, partial [Pseudonocardiaceae bacterium]